MERWILRRCCAVSTEREGCGEQQRVRIEACSHTDPQAPRAVGRRHATIPQHNNSATMATTNYRAPVLNPYSPKMLENVLEKVSAGRAASCQDRLVRSTWSDRTAKQSIEPHSTWTSKPFQNGSTYATRRHSVAWVEGNRCLGSN